MGLNETKGRDDYFAAGFEILAGQGPEALTIAELCTRLGVTKGSFYHHFAGMPDFARALVAHWESEYSERLIALSSERRDPTDRMQVLTDIAAGLPHELEAAFRMWGRDNPDIAAAQRRVDQAREDHIAESNELLGLAPDRARRIARMAMAILIGIQLREHPVDVDEVYAMYREVDESILGLPADAIARSRKPPGKRTPRRRTPRT